MKWFIPMFLLLLQVCSCSGPTSSNEDKGWQTSIPLNSYNSTPPIIYNDLVVVQLVDSLWALDKDSGHVEWSLKLQDGRAVTYTVPQYDNYAFYCGKREVYKVDLETGMIVWEFQTASTTDVRHLSIDSEYLHFGTASGAYYQINLETGQLASYFMISGENVISATAHEDKVFICSYSPAILLPAIPHCLLIFSIFVPSI